MSKMMEKLRERELVRVLSFMGPRSWIYYPALVVYALVLGTCFNLVLAFVLGDVVDAAVAGDQAILLHGIKLALGTLALGLPVLTVARYLIKFCTRKTMSDVRLRVFQHIEDLPMHAIDSQHSGDLISRCMNDVGQMETVFGQLLQTFGYFLVMGVVGMVFVFTIEWRLGLLALVLGLSTSALNMAFSRPIRVVNDDIRVLLGKLTERLTDLLQSLPVTKMFHIHDAIFSRYSGENDNLAGAEIKLARIDAFRTLLAHLTASVREVGVLVLGLLLVLDGQLEMGSIWAIVYLLGNSNIMFSYLGGFVSYLQQCLAGASRVLDLLDRPTEAEGLPEQPPVTVMDDDSMLLLSDLSFSYAADDQTILNGISLRAQQGQRVALVGPSGGGKSTIIKLLLGFYSAQAGAVAVHGKSLSEYSLHDLRDMIAYVPQDAYLFDGTIEENIRYGRPDASLDEVMGAAKAAYAHDFIMEQADGYATRVGERGAKLSGGQRQRIAIARALIKDAPILLLDEATSSLDSGSEQQVQAALDVLMDGRTTMAIAHRLSTIVNADQIYVIEHGQVVEQGRHDALLAADGLYASLYTVEFGKHTDVSGVAV